MNNKYLNCPPLMSDGRIFTDYRPRDYVNNLMRMASDTMTSYDYKQFLTQHAELIIKANKEYIEDKTRCAPCFNKPVPFNTKCEYDLSTMSCEMKNKNGIGVYNKH
jgi:hypothetical protein